MTAASGLSIAPFAEPTPDALAHLVAEGAADGHRYMARLAAEYASGVNRFDGPSEALFVARWDGAFVGVGGLNVDPYEQSPRIGRVRHVYVARSARRHGVARALLARLVEAASASFDTLTLRTENPAAARLYRSFAFSEEPRFAEATHWRQLTGTPEFGLRVPDATYVDRPGAYGVATDADGWVLVVYCPAGCFLPGGGLEAGEDPEEALAREFREETGLSATVRRAIGGADELIGGSGGVPGMRKRGQFYRVDVSARRGIPEEPDHRPVWLPPDGACEALRDGSHRWAVRMALLNG